MLLFKQILNLVTSDKQTKENNIGIHNFVLLSTFNKSTLQIKWGGH